MAVEWYLMGDDVSLGMPSDEEANEFNELLETGIGIPIEVYNYELSLITETRAIVENKVPNTLLQSIKLQMAVPVGTAVAGNYVKYKNRYWLVVGLVDDNNGIYEKLVLRTCNYLLTWLNNRGKIIQRWAVAESASQYNNGETNMIKYYVRSDQMLILIPDDDESVIINDGQRFVIDRKTKIYEKQIKNGADMRANYMLDVYQCTRDDSVYYDFTDLDGNSSGVMQFMAYQDEQRETDGYYVVDGKGYWLCDIPNISDIKEVNENRDVFRIKHVSNYLYVGMGYSTYTADVPDGVSVSWGVDGDIVESLDVVIDDNAISIKTDDENNINKTFILSMTSEGYDTALLKITVKEFI